LKKNVDPAIFLLMWSGYHRDVKIMKNSSPFSTMPPGEILNGASLYKNQQNYHQSSRLEVQEEV
jgi:hypothetical protein